MSTVIRPEISDKNKYWIEKHRYYELKHFCLQYPIWKREYNSVDSISRPSLYTETFSKNYNISDPVSKCVEVKVFYSTCMEMIQNATKESDETLSKYILKGVTEGYSYDHLKVKLDMPCCKSTYYDLYRKFFWILSKERQ